MSHKNREWKVTSLELSQKLDVEHRRLGIVVESEWYWVNMGRPNGRANWKLIIRNNGKNKIYPHIDGHPDWSIIPALDTSELGEMLPSYIVSDNQECSLEQYGEDDFSIEYQSDFAIRDGMKSAFCPFTVIEKYEAEARGKMYLWLLQNGYVKGERE